MRTRLTAGLAAAAALALPLLVTSPAFAAGPALPEGNHLYAMPCDDGDTEGNFYGVDSVSAALTVLATSDLECVGSMAFDPTTGVSYAFDWNDGELVPFVAATGYFGEDIPLTGGESSSPDGLAIGMEGQAFITSGQSLSSVNLTTGVQTIIGDMGDNCMYAFTADPTTGKFYSIQCDTGTIYEVNTTTAVLTAVGEVFPGDPEFDQGIYSLRIDTAGTWWIEAEPTDNAELYSFAGLAGAATPVLSGEFTVNGAAEYTEAILITWDPAPALAATGLDGFATFSLLGGGVLLLMAGGVVLITARRTRNQY